MDVGRDKFLGKMELEETKFLQEKRQEREGSIWGRANSFIIASTLNWLSRKPVPNHVAFIMDGNRRYAKSLGLEKIQGHVSGFDKLLNILEWCLKLKIKTVTVYAFSIENFKRPKHEVEGLMSLAEEKFIEFLEHESLVMQHGVKVRILGNLQLLPKKVKRAVANVMLHTKDNSNALLNICFPYSSKEEITRLTQNTVIALKSGKLKGSDIDYQFLSNCLYTRGNEPDLLIRTSGETRLSDFLVWQLRFACLQFVPVLWPDLTLWDLVWCILRFQTSAPSLRNLRNTFSKQSKEAEESTLRKQNHLESLDLKEEKLLLSWVSE